MISDTWGQQQPPNNLKFMILILFGLGQSLPFSGYTALDATEVNQTYSTFGTYLPQNSEMYHTTIGMINMYHLNSKF